MPSSDDPTRWKGFGWMCGLIIAFLQNKMKELDLKEKSSKSLLANVLDMDDDYRPSSALPQVLFCQAKSLSNYSLCQKILMPLTFNKIECQGLLGTVAVQSAISEAELAKILPQDACQRITSSELQNPNPNMLISIFCQFDFLEWRFD